MTKEMTIDKIEDNEIIDSGILLDEGFVFIVIKVNGEDHTLQACLCKSEDDKKYIKKINKNDNGMNWGLCGDANEFLFNKYGEEEATNYFYKKVEKLLDVKIN